MPNFGVIKAQAQATCSFASSHAMFCIKMLIADIRHFTDGSPELPTPARKLRDFLAHIIRAGTAAGAVNFISGIPCRKKVARRACPGLIWVNRINVPSDIILWCCDSCKDSGEISGHLGHWSDLSSVSVGLDEDRDADEENLDVMLTNAEFKALISSKLIPYNLESVRLIYSAYACDEGIVLSGWESDLDLLRDAVAADANHEKSRVRKKFIDSFYNKLCWVLDGAMDRCESVLH